MNQAFAEYTDVIGTPNRNRRHILLIDDDISLEPVWRAIINKLKCPCELDWVASSAAAERLLFNKKKSNEHYDVILCDIFLSGSKTGLDFVNSFANEPTEYIFTSGVCPHKLTKMLSQQSRKYRILQKPLDLEACQKVLNEVLEANDHLRE